MDHAQELPAGAGGGDPEVPEKAKRRQFDSAYKLRILEEADRSTAVGQLGELLRREGLYSSHLTLWRRQRDEGSLAGLTPKRRGRARESVRILWRKRMRNCSVRTMYRLLHEESASKERRNQLRHPNYKKLELLATGPKHETGPELRIADLGLTYERYQQTLRNADVLGGQLTVYRDALGATTTAIGAYYIELIIF